ncbi:MBL fold metallo-hydrolase [Candidatus Saccharibacteria bacterium]|nr:MBL fold metallo-hydrolase [Candidatus Saccharibacteria bacterium]
MDIQYYGANCIRISTKKGTLVVDDNIASLGGSNVARPGDIVAFTGPVSETKDARFIISRPGDYEIADISINGVSARSHMDEEDASSATMYRIVVDDIRLAIVGHIYPKLSDVQLEALGAIDILLVPVGGNGFTLDTTGALEIIKKIDPKVVIPTQYSDNDLSYEVPAVSLDEALKGLGMEVKDTLSKYKVKPAELLGDKPQLLVLERQ